jgi:hypothetical protein
MTKLESNLLDAMEVCTTITCSKCRKHTDYHGVNEFDVLDTVIEDGWYATDANVYCPKCEKDRQYKKKNKLPKVGDKVKVVDSGIDGSLLGIPLVIVDKNNRRKIKHNNGVITKVKHGRKQNKGSHTFTITPNKGKVV